MDEAFAYCADLLRREDKDRFLADLFAPSARRGALHALHAFDLETSRIASRVHEAMAGEIRLQWWREVLDGGRAGEARANPVAAALLAAVAAHDLPREALAGLIEARAFDLYRDPMPTLEALDGYAGHTAVAVVRLSARVLGAAHPGLAVLIGAAGRASLFVDLLRRLPADASNGRLYLPADLLYRHGARPEDVLAGRAGQGLSDALAELRAEARRNAEVLRQGWRGIPQSLRPAFLPARLAPLYLTAMDVSSYDPFTTPVAVAQWRRQWRLWRAMREASFRGD